MSPVDFDNLTAEQTEVVEKLASDAGWVPEDQWKGDAGKHKPAAEYMRDSKKVINNQKVANRSLEGQLSKLNKKFDSMELRHQQETMAEITALKDRLKEQQRTAVEDGDTDKYDQISKELDGLEEKHREVAKTAEGSGGTESPVFLGWHENNKDWYETNPEMTAEADRFHQSLNDDLSLAEKLAFVDTHMRGAYPDYYKSKGGGNEQEQISDAEAGGGGGVGGGGGKLTYANLPPAGKSACDSFVAAKMGTQADYLKSMQQQEEEYSDVGY
ncbi:MAG: hypothetical protein KOO63_05600 [Bacteroidales bacterium]|nr:hypothetical protein [Candidatus Latescibacterota bacterium]